MPVERMNEKRLPVIEGHIVKRSQNFAAIHDERVWRKVYREDARRKQGGRCCYCGVTLKRDDATADHVVARRKGGQTSKNNIKAACKPCNKAKRSMTENKFKRLIRDPSGTDCLDIHRAAYRYRISIATDKACANILRSVSIKAKKTTWT